MFMFMFIFQFVFMLHIKFMFHEHIYTYCISYTFLIHASYIWHFIDLYMNTYTCTCPYHRHLLIQCDAYILTHHSCILFLYESILLRNWNHSNWIIQTQVMAFSCHLVGLSGQFAIFISSALSPYLTLVLCTPLNLRC